MRNMFTPRGRLYVVPRQSEASIRRILSRDPEVQTLSKDMVSYNDYSASVPLTAIVSRVEGTKRGTVIRRRRY